jgi:hypothetical protein
MLALFAIVAVAVLVAAASKAETARPWGAVATGTLCIALGCQSVAIWTDTMWGLALTKSAAAAEVAPTEVVAEVDEPLTPDADASLLDQALDSAEEAASSEDELTADDEPVKYITHVTYLTPNRPEWLDSPRNVDNGVTRLAVKAGPYYRPQQCREDLDIQLRKATDEFVCDYLNNPRASILIAYGVDEIKNRFVRERFDEKLETSVGPMNQSHALLEFDEPFCDELQQRWREVKSFSRLLQTGLGSGIVLLLVTTLFGYFRLDTATKGYYTGRLQFMAAGAILSLVAASVLLAKWIPWM